MPRPPGSKNKKTLLREAAERAAATPPLLQSTPFEPGEERPGLPATEIPTPRLGIAKHVEYPAPGGDHWRIENGQDLLVFFDMSIAEVARWHEALAPEKNVWHVLRRFYGIAPLVGESNVEYLSPAGLEEIAKPLGLDAANVQRQLDSAKQFWVRWRLAHKSMDDQKIEIAPSVPPEQVDALLKRYGFSDLSDQDHRQYAAQRLTDFKHKLEDEEGGSLPPQAIRLEIQLTNIDKIIDRLAQTAETDADKREEMRVWMNMRDKVGAQHIQVMEALNATQAQNPSAQRKVAFIDCLGTLVKAVQEWESRGDTELIDGIHTAGEIEFLVTPTTLRPAQYRPDAIAILNDALKHSNLWDPDYVAPSLSRAVHRRLLKGFQDGVRIATSEDGPVMEMEDEESAAPVQEFGAGGEPGSQIPMESSQPPSLGAAGHGGRLLLGKNARKAGNEFIAG